MEDKEEFYTANVLEAIQGMLKGQEVQKCDKYLKQFQKSKAAWKIITDIMKIENLANDERLMLCTFLRTKLIYDFDQLKGPNGLDDQTFTLRDTLIEQLKLGTIPGRSLILDNISECLGLLAPQIYKEWPDFITSIQSLLFSQISQVVLGLRVLSAIITESNRTELVIDADNRDLYQLYLEGEAPKVISMLHNWATNIISRQIDISHPHCKDLPKHILICLTNWLDFRLPMETILQIDTNHRDLINLPFALLDSDYYEEAAKCCCAFIRYSAKEEENLQPQIEILKGNILGKIQEIGGLFENSFAQGKTERFDVLVELHVYLVNTFLNVLIESPEERIFNMLIKCLLIEEIEYRKNCLFWEDILTCVHNKIKDTSNTEESNKYKKMYEPYINQLILASIQTLVIEESLFKEMNFINNSDEMFDEVYRKRDYIFKIIESSSGILGFKHIYSIIYPTLESCIKQIQANPEDIPTWLKIESALYVMGISTVYSHRSHMEEIKLIFQFLEVMNPSLVQLQRTTILLIQNVSELLYLEPKLLVDSINFLFKALPNPLLKKRGGNALMEIFDNSNQYLIEKGLLTDLFQELIKVIAYTEGMKDDIIGGIFCSFSYVISSMTDSLKIKTGIERLLQPFATTIMQICKSETLDNKILEEKMYYIVYILEGAEELSRFKEDENPFLDLYPQLYPVFNSLLANPETSESVLEKICSAIKYILRILRNNFIPYLDAFILCITDAYQKKPISTFIYCAEFIVKEFGMHPSVQGKLRHLFNFICSETFKLLTDIKSFVTNPHIVEDFFGMCLRYTEYAPEIFFSSPLFSQLFHCAVAGIGLEHKKAAASIYLFICELYLHIQKAQSDFQKKQVAISTITQELGKFLINNTQILMNKLVNSLIAGPPRYIVKYIIRLIGDMIEIFPTQTIQAIAASIQIVPHDILTIEEKQSFPDKLNCGRRFEIKNELKILADRCQRSARRNK